MAPANSAIIASLVPFISDFSILASLILYAKSQQVLFSNHLLSGNLTRRNVYLHVICDLDFVLVCLAYVYNCFLIVCIFRPFQFVYYLYKWRLCLSSNFI